MTRAKMIWATGMLFLFFAGLIYVANGFEGVRQTSREVQTPNPEGGMTFSRESVSVFQGAEEACFWIGLTFWVLGFGLTFAP